MIKQIWDKIAYAWWTPSAFRDDWRKYAKNQVGHMIGVGTLPAVLFGWFGVVVVLSLFAMWEGTQWWLRRAEPSDAFEDWGFALGGALLGATLDLGYGALMFILLMAGILWRMED